MIANGKLKNQLSGNQPSSAAKPTPSITKSQTQYQSSMSGTKVNTSIGGWNRNSGPAGSDRAANIQNYMNSSNKRKYTNPYVYHRTNTSKNLHNLTVSNLTSNLSTNLHQKEGANFNSHSVASDITQAGPGDRRHLPGTAKIREKSLPCGPSSIHQRDFRRSHGGPSGLNNYSTTIKPREGSASLGIRSSDNNSRVRNSLHSIAHLDQQRQQSITELRNPMRNPTTTTIGDKNQDSSAQKIKDIRDATTVQEVRDIMNQVKSRYRNISHKKTLDDKTNTSYSNM